MNDEVEPNENRVFRCLWRPLVTEINMAEYCWCCKQREALVDNSHRNSRQSILRKSWSTVSISRRLHFCLRGERWRHFVIKGVMHRIPRVPSWVRLLTETAHAQIVSQSLHRSLKKNRTMKTYFRIESFLLGHRRRCSPMSPSHNPRREWIHICHCKLARSISDVAWTPYSNLERGKWKDKTATFQKFLGDILGS